MEHDLSGKDGAVATAPPLRIRLPGLGSQEQLAHAVVDSLGKSPLPPVFKEALELTGFALDEFKRRADQDGVHLVILAVHHNGDSRNPFQVTLDDLAAPRGILVLSQHDHILRQGGAIEDANWPYDGHWTPAGHQWAAEVMLDHLKQNPELCLS